MGQSKEQQGAGEQKQGAGQLNEVIPLEDWNQGTMAGQSKELQGVGEVKQGAWQLQEVKPLEDNQTQQGLAMAGHGVWHAQGATQPQKRSMLSPVVVVCPICKGGISGHTPGLCEHCCEWGLANEKKTRHHMMLGQWRHTGVFFAYSVMRGDLSQGAGCSYFGGIQGVYCRLRSQRGDRSS